MNNLMSSLVYIVIITTTVSCNKNGSTNIPPTAVNKELSSGLPINSKAINGYFYSGYQSNITNSSSNNTTVGSSWAIFSDPAKQLLNSYNHYQTSGTFSNFGNIDVGNVTLLGSALLKGSQPNFGVSYSNYNNYVTSIPYGNINWTTEGNGSFLPLKINIGKGVPVINTSLININYSISKNIDYIINFGSNISNYDSLIVTLNGNNFNEIIRKVLPINSNSVTFKSQELSSISTTSYARLNIYAFNYSNNIVNDKVNLFELSNKVSYNNISLY